MTDQVGESVILVLPAFTHCRLPAWLAVLRRWLAGRF